MSTNILDNPEISTGVWLADSPWPGDFRERASDRYHGPVRLLHGKAWNKREFVKVERLQSALRSAKTCGLKTLVNTTPNPLLPYLVEGIEKAQRESGRIARRRSDLIFVDEVRLRRDLLAQGSAILAAAPTAVPGDYRVIQRIGGVAIAVPRKCGGGLGNR